jgi:L-asparaginase/Glu-tRNA(Gln) amidotransferase subunit D
MALAIEIILVPPRLLFREQKQKMLLLIDFYCSPAAGSILFAEITNGAQIKKVTIIHTNVTIGARQSAPVARNESKNGGTTHTTDCDTGATKPK